MNIVDPILFQARYNPGGAAICVPWAQWSLISYARLESVIHNVTRAAVAAGVVRGNIVAILVEDTIFHAAILLAVTRLGAITLSTRGERLPPELGVDIAITDRPRGFENVRRVVVADKGWTEGEGRPLADERLYCGGGDDICRIVLTSGTTGEPKGIALSHKLVFERIARDEFVKGYRFPTCSRLYCDLPIGSSAGFRYLVNVLWKGGTIMFYGADPDGTVQAFDLYKVQNMVVSPDGLMGFLKFYELNSGNRCGLDHIISLGGMLSKPLADRVRARMCSHLFSVYGSTEVGTVASAHADDIAVHPGAVGHVTPGVTVEIADEAGHPLPPGQEGRVRIRSAYNVRDYVGDPVASAAAFRDGWFYPGDIGRLGGDKLLTLSGRESAVLNLGGDKIRPELVEEVLAAFAGVAEAAVFARGNELGVAEIWAAIVPRGVLDEQGLRAWCAQRLRPTTVPRRFLTVTALPRNQMGKLDRARLPDLAKH